MTNADLATCAVTNDKVRLCWGENILDELGLMPQAFLEPAETWAQPWSPGKVRRHGPVDAVALVQ